MPDTAPLTFRPKKILFPTDFSPSACAALLVAGELALQFGAELYLLNVIPMLPIVPNIEFAPQFFPPQEFLQDARDDAAKRLNASVEALASKNIKSKSSVEVDDNVVATILMVLEREHIDILVISTHGMSGWRPMIFGSIAEGVMKLIDCPLLLLHSPKEPSSPKQPLHSAA